MSVCPCLRNGACRKKIVKSKEAPLGETSLEILLVLLLRAWIRVSANLFSHYRCFLHPRLSAAVARTRAKTNLLSLLGQGETSEYLPPLLEEAGKAIGQT
jgi:hypothetical protein